jgi:hypothetical protein
MFLNYKNIVGIFFLSTAVMQGATEKLVITDEACKHYPAQPHYYMGNSPLFGLFQISNGKIGYPAIHINDFYTIDQESGKPKRIDFRPSFIRRVLGGCTIKELYLMQVATHKRFERAKISFANDMKKKLGKQESDDEQVRCEQEALKKYPTWYEAVMARFGNQYGINVFTGLWFPFDLDASRALFAHARQNYAVRTALLGAILKDNQTPAADVKK